MLPGGFASIGKTLIFAGVFLIILGILVHFGGKFINLGRLPGDIRFEKENFSFYFPLASSILVSLILTILLNIFTRR